jgi:RNA 2',3'-cyclic 3'-phosphodiesterase
VQNAASVESREPLRLFVALLLPKNARARLSAWQEHELSGQPGLRLVPAANLHVTIAFLGGRPPEDVDRVAGVLRDAARALAPPVLEPMRYRETRSVAMIVLTDQGNRATALAERVFEGLERIGVYERESRDWLPHITVARFRRRARLAPPVPPLGGVVSSEMAVMLSRLRPGGAEYEVLESVSLGG